MNVASSMMVGWSKTTVARSVSHGVSSSLSACTRRVPASESTARSENGFCSADESNGSHAPLQHPAVALQTSDTHPCNDDGKRARSRSPLSVWATRPGCCERPPRAARPFASRGSRSTRTTTSGSIQGASKLRPKSLSSAGDGALASLRSSTATPTAGWPSRAQTAKARRLRIDGCLARASSTSK
eukprot:6865532-Prymnesium_polylepis.1